jgi:hypothetical protein
LCAAWLRERQLRFFAPSFFAPSFFAGFDFWAELDGAGLPKRCAVDV